MSELALELSQVGKRFTLVELERLLELRPQDVIRRIVAVRDVTLSIDSGQVYGFLGPNGAGKTTTIKMAMDLISPTHGQIRLWGRDPRDPAVKRRIGYLPEHPYFYDYLKPQEILDYFGRLFGMDKKARTRRVGELLERVGLTQARNRALRKFSKGMLQRLGVAQALINDPDLLVLDEPLSGLDPMGRKDIRDIIIEERRKGKTIFFSSHILSDIEHICDRVAIIVEGRVVREGPLGSLLEGEQRKTEILISKASDALRARLGAEGQLVDLGDVCRVTVDTQKTSALIETALGTGACIDRLEPRRDSLEEFFVRVAAQEGS